MEQAGIVIAGIIYLIPVAALIWKAATLSNKVLQNEKDIAAVKQQVSSQSERIIASLEELNKTMNAIKLDVEILKLRKGEVKLEETK